MELTQFTLAIISNIVYKQNKSTNRVVTYDSRPCQNYLEGEKALEIENEARITCP